MVKIYFIHANFLPIITKRLPSQLLHQVYNNRFRSTVVKSTFFSSESGQKERKKNENEMILLFGRKEFYFFLQNNKIISFWRQKMTSLNPSLTVKGCSICCKTRRRTWLNFHSTILQQCNNLLGVLPSFHLSFIRRQRI